MEFKLIYPSKEDKALSDLADIRPQIEENGKPSSIIYKLRGREVEVNLVNGRFCIDGSWIEPAIDEENFADKNGYRPVYFRRVLQAIHIGEGNPEEERINYFLGWQLTNGGNNFKYFACIHPDGGVSIGESRK